MKFHTGSNSEQVFMGIVYIMVYIADRVLDGKHSGIQYNMT